MDGAEIEAFFQNCAKRIPAVPAWRDHGSRASEKKTRLAIEVDGAISKVELEITLRINDPTYIVIVLIAPHCIARLCIGTPHRNRITGETLSGPHYHDWLANRHLPKRELINLPYCQSLPDGVEGRDAAFSWFLNRVGIESPDWLPVKWPTQGDLF